MSTEIERRAPGAVRIPFEALVEVGGAIGTAFEAEAVNLSTDGMLLRTAYLPEPGQTLTCRFDGGSREGVLASGEVVWVNQHGKGGEFGIRFTDLDAESLDALRGILGLNNQEEKPMISMVGSKVRLHIEGLNSPMRARVRDAQDENVIVGSELGFLQVGKELSLEDAESGTKRAARIDGVNVEVDGTSHVPQLVVKLRYADASSMSGKSNAMDDDAYRTETRTEARTEGGERMDRAKAETESSLDSLKGPVAKAFSRVGPKMESFTKQMATTAHLLWAKRSSMFGSKSPDAPRRQTAPAPNGTLQANGRGVVRSGPSANEGPSGVATFIKTHRKQMIIGGGVSVGLLMAAFAIGKPSSETPIGPVAKNTSADIGRVTIVAEAEARAAAQPPAMIMPPANVVANVPNGDGPQAGNGDAPKKKHKVTPFGNGSVKHGNVLAIKMDGTIDKIQGAAQPAGFVVHIPGRHSVESASALVQRDARLSSIKVTNDSKGAELTVAFKDGVPTYQVRARGDKLELVIATPGKAGDKKIAKKNKKKKAAH